MNCKRCGGPKPPGRGRQFCSDECRALGPAEGVRRCPDCDEDRLVPAQMRAKALYCERCLKERARAQARRHYAANREKVKAAVKAYREQHAEAINAYKREHYQANRETIRARQAAYYRQNKAAQKDRAHRWYVANRDKHRAATARYRRTHRELVRERNRDWYRRLMSDPVRREERRELARMDLRLRAEQQGRTMKPVPVPVYVKRFGSARGRRAPHVNAAPLRKLLHRVEDLEALAEGIGVSESFLDRIRQGHYEQVSVRDADAICVAFDIPLTLIYGEQAA